MIRSDNKWLELLAEGLSSSAGAAAPTTAAALGGVFNTTAPTYTNGQLGQLQIDSKGNLSVTQATLIAGEDLNNDLTKVEQRYIPTRVTADTQIKSGAGFLHTITIAPTTAVPTAGLVTIYDSLTETGTILYSEWVFATTLGHTVIIDGTFVNGLYVGYDGTLANVSVTVSNR